MMQIVTEVEVNNFSGHGIDQIVSSCQLGLKSELVKEGLFAIAAGTSPRDGMK